jgi:hypothetical protein
VKITINRSKSTQIAFIPGEQKPSGNANGQAPKKSEVKYLGMRLGRRLTWTKHMTRRINQLHLKAKQVHWLVARSPLLTESKVLYKAVLKPIWTEGIQT